MQFTPASAMFNPLHHDSLFYISTKSTHILTSENPAEAFHIQPTPSDPDCPHSFYQPMLQWNTNFIEMAEQLLLESLFAYDMHICVDGAFLKEHGQHSHAWVFSNGSHRELWKGAGPTFGHSDLKPPYNVELSGFTSVLFILHWFCYRNATGDRKDTIYRHNEAALNETFGLKHPTDNLYHWLAADN